MTATDKFGPSKVIFVRVNGMNLDLKGQDFYYQSSKFVDGARAEGLTVEKIIYFTRGHIDTYLWWNRSPNCRILFFACFTNSSLSSLWNTSKSQEKLLESLLISTLQILGNSRWCPKIGRASCRERV